METLPEVTFRGLQRTRELDDEIRFQLEKLDRICGNIISCRIGIEKRQRFNSQGSPFRVRLALAVPPGHEIVIVKGQKKSFEDHQPLLEIVHQAFEAAQRRLRKLRDIQNREVKRHPEQEVNGIVDKLYRQEGYGFIRTESTSQVYFHRNAVLHNKFDRLHLGDGVHFNSEEGEQGPQATTVRLIEKTEL